MSSFPSTLATPAVCEGVMSRQSGTESILKKYFTVKKVDKHCQSRYPLLLQRLNERGDYSFSLPNGSLLSSSSRWKLKLQTVVTCDSISIIYFDIVNVNCFSYK